MKNLTAVLNTSTEEVVMLDLSDKLIIKTGLVTYLDELDIATITNDDYQYIASELNIGEVDDKLVQSYFVKRCREASSKQIGFINDEGYAYIYHLLKEASYSFKCLIDEMPKIIATWREGTPEEVLDELSIDHSNLLQESKHSCAWAALNNHDFKSFETSYMIDGEMKMLYSGF